MSFFSSISGRFVLLTGLLLTLAGNCYAQSPEDPDEQRPLTRKEIRQERKKQKNMPLDLPELRTDPFMVSGGQRQAAAADSMTMAVMDSLQHIGESLLADSLSAEQLGRLIPQIDEQGMDTIRQIQTVRDSTLTVTEIIGQDSLQLLTGSAANDSRSISKRERKAMERLDSMYYRHSPLFRDTLKPGTVSAISFVVPGFAQLYKGDYWKIPVLYATAGAGAFFGFKQHQKYRIYKNEYDLLTSQNETKDNRELIDPVQTNMIRHNTWRQLFFGAAIGSYLYFLGDGIISYPGPGSDHVRKATMLSLICPGAGQIYNKSYWRAPIFIGGLATFIYVTDFNNRVYQRYKRAYELTTDGDPETTDEFGGRYDASYLLNNRTSARRARDLALIMTAAFYLINVMDAHVNAHLNDYDISDNLAFTLEPSMNNVYMPSQGNVNLVGLSLNLRF